MILRFIRRQAHRLPQFAKSFGYGGPAREVVNLLTTQEAHNLTSPPTRTWNIHYTVWMAESAASSPGGGAA